MKSSVQDRAEGTARELKGKAKKEWGRATGNPQKKAEGAIESATGKFQKKSGEIKRDVTRD